MEWLGGVSLIAIAMSTLYQGAYFAIQHYRASGCVRVVRNDAPFEAVTDAVSGLAACRAALAGLDAARYGLLLDWRLAPISTDPNLHKVLVEHIDALAAPFARKAILVATTVGTMQANSVGRNLSENSLAVFNDEAAAMRFITSR